MTATYQYKALTPEPGRIRLLRLFKSPPTDPIRCELFESSLQEDEGIPYDALSYTWGSNAVFESITVEDAQANGQVACSTLSVTTNLHTALRYIRSQDLDLVLWIDAVCIDQKNPQEKSVQIGQMRTVYERAEQVLIWLGIGNQNAETAMDAMCRLEEEARSDRKAWKAPERRLEIAGRMLTRLFGDTRGATFRLQVEAFEDLLARPWFKRAWIIQEVASARAASFVCGSRSAPAAIFGLMPSLLGVKVSRHVQAVLDVLPGHPRGESWWTQRRDLLFLLDKFAYSMTSEPQDRVYALLGISSDASDTSVFRPDYGISFEDTLQDTLSFLVLGSTQVHRTDDQIRLPKYSLSNMIQTADAPRNLAMRVLRWAVLERHERTILMLLKHNGLDLDRTIFFDLMERGGYKEAVKNIIRHKDFDRKMVSEGGETPMEMAVRVKDESAARWLLWLVKIRAGTGEAGALSAVETARRYLMAKKLVLKWAQIGMDSSETLGKSSESVARRAEGVHQVGTDVPHVENENDAALSYAARNGRVYSLVKLARYGADLASFRDARGRTLLSLAASAGSLSTVKYIERQMKDAVDIDSRDVDGRTALSLAAEKGHLQIVEFLVHAGADAGARDLSGTGVLDWLADATGKEPDWERHLTEWTSSARGHVQEGAYINVHASRRARESGQPTVVTLGD